MIDSLCLTSGHHAAVAYHQRFFFVCTLLGNGCGDISKVGDISGKFRKSTVFENVCSRPGGRNSCFPPNIFSYPSGTMEIDAGEPHSRGRIQPQINTIQIQRRRRRKLEVREGGYPGASLWTNCSVCFCIASRPLGSENPGPSIPNSSKSIVESMPPTYLLNPHLLKGEVPYYRFKRVDQPIWDSKVDLNSVIQRGENVIF